MNKLIKGVFIPLVVSILFGFVSARLVYGIYGDEVLKRLSSSRVYLIEKGEYLTYDSMREENIGNNYVYYVDDNVYNTVVGITKYEENIDKIKSLYDDNCFVKEYYVASELLSEKQEEYDLVLNNSENIYEVKNVVDNILNLYKDDDDIRLIFVN